MENEIKCDSCGSTNLTANKKGFSGTKALGGAVLAGGIGLLAGTHGSNKVIITCLNCGHQWKAGNDNAGKRRKRKQEAELTKSPVFWVIFSIFIILFLKCIF